MLRKYVEKLIEKNGIERQSIVAMEKCSDELEKALDKACELITEAVSQDCTIFDEVIEEEYMWRTEIDDWKEWCIKNG